MFGFQSLDPHLGRGKTQFVCLMLALRTCCCCCCRSCYVVVVVVVAVVVAVVVLWMQAVLSKAWRRRYATTLG